MPPEVITYDLHVHFFPAEDVPGIWVAHCLDFDVVSQGTSLSDAMGMIREAVELTVIDDLGRGLDPHLRRAPKEEWDAFWGAVAGAVAQPVGLVLERAGEIRSVVTFPTMTVTRVRAPTPSMGTAYDMPLAFAQDARAVG